MNTNVAGSNIREQGARGNKASSAHRRAVTEKEPASTVTVRDNDVLSGRGVSISSHEGNKRFRKLVSSHYDTNYCTTYKTNEKRAVADKIIAHIQGLDPPGRFLKRTGRNKSCQGLEGPWEELSYQAALKKTTQALRDANRDDRSGYAVAVPVPEDVKQHIDQIKQEGLTKQQFARKAAAEIAAKTETMATPAVEQPKRGREETLPPSPPGPVESTSITSSPPTFSDIETGTEWIKRPRLESDSLGPLPSVTPSTALRPGGAIFEQEDDRKMPARQNFYEDAMSSDPHPHHSVFHDSPRLPADDSGEENFAATFKRTTHDPLDAMAAHAAAGLDDATDYPSPFHDEDVELSAEHAFD